MSLQTKSVLVSRLTDSVTKEDIKTAFQTIGSVQAVLWRLDGNGDQTGVAIVIFDQTDDVDKAITKKTVGSWTISVGDVSDADITALKRDQDFEEDIFKRMADISLAG
ncbi:MAG: RNA-binding protein [Desulfobulbaceae bacterium]|nr:RNA-binding protein [Desulfobulbaceae bacterium]